VANKLGELYLLNETNGETALIKKDFSKNIQQLIDHTNKIFNMENLGLCNDSNFDDRINIYNKNIHKEIDELNSKIHSGKETVENLSRILMYKTLL
jgi:hypothetical protein